MQRFRKYIYGLNQEQGSKGNLPGSFTLIDSQEEGEGGCTSCVTLTVNVPAGTNKRVEFVMSGDNGQYSAGFGLCTGTGVSVVSDSTTVISTTTTFKFGIDATKIAPNAFSNTITVSIFDNDTNDFDVAFNTTRTHGNVNC